MTEMSYLSCDTVNITCSGFEGKNYYSVLLIHIQNVPSLNIPALNVPSLNVPITKCPITECLITKCPITKCPIIWTVSQDKWII